LNQSGEGTNTYGEEARVVVEAVKTKTTKKEDIPKGKGGAWGKKGRPS